MIQVMPCCLYPLFLQCWFCWSCSRQQQDPSGYRKDSLCSKQGNIQLPDSLLEIPQTPKPSNSVSKHHRAFFPEGSQRGSYDWQIQQCNIALQRSLPGQLSQRQQELPENSRVCLVILTLLPDLTLQQSLFPFTIWVHKLDATGLKKYTGLEFHKALILPQDIFLKTSRKSTNDSRRQIQK